MLECCRHLRGRNLLREERRYIYAAERTYKLGLRDFVDYETLIGSAQLVLSCALHSCRWEKASWTKTAVNKPWDSWALPQDLFFAKDCSRAARVSYDLLGMTSGLQRKRQRAIVKRKCKKHSVPRPGMETELPCSCQGTRLKRQNWLNEENNKKKRVPRTCVDTRVPSI